MTYRQSPRLTSFEYKGTHAYNLTLVTRERAPIFRDEKWCERYLPILSESCQAKDFTLLAYCFMPDHLHLLLQGMSPSSDLQAFVRVFKQRTGADFKGMTGQFLWQMSYYDHVVRHEESIETIARYIWDNPVRGGLVANRMEYSHSGPRDVMTEGMA